MLRRLRKVAAKRDEMILEAKEAGGVQIVGAGEAGEGRRRRARPAAPDTEAAE